MDAAKEVITPLYQCLTVKVRLEDSILKGRTSFWLRHLPTSHGRGDSYPTEIALHCRQCRIKSTKVNGCKSSFSHLDPLVRVVHDPYRDAETFDICYRAELYSNVQDLSGELRVQVPTNCNRNSTLPPELPETAPPAARARWQETVRLIQKSKEMEQRSEEKRKQASRTPSITSPDAFGSPLVGQSPLIQSPVAQSPMMGTDVSESPTVGGNFGTRRGSMEEDDEELDEDEMGEAKSAAVEAHRRMKREENARVLCVEVEWELSGPRSGVVFKTAANGFSASHMYTTYSHSPVDVDGPRCWFPCLDHVSMLITYDITVILQSSKLTAAFNGKLLETKPTTDAKGNEGVSYRFATEALTAARGVGLVVGRFGTWDVPQSPRVKGMFLRPASHSGGSGSKGSTNASTRKHADASLAEATGGLLAHVSAAIAFMEEWLKTDYPFKKCTQVFVEGLSDVYAPFGSICLVKAELLCTPQDRIPDGDVPADARLSVVEVLLYGWVSTALRLEGGRHRWLVHGIAGYLLTQFASELRGEEERQHTLWRAMQRAVALDCELGCPSISPPTPDLYIPDAIDPATAAYCRLKSALIFHMIEVKLGPTDLQDALGQVMRPIAAHIKDQGVGLRTQQSFPLQRQASTMSHASLARQPSLASLASTDGRQAGGGAAAVAAVNPTEEVGGHFMQPLDSLRFMQMVRGVAARGGHDLGKDLPEGFYQQWVTGQCLPYLRVGYHYKKKANMINLVLEQVVPPWMGGIACHGSFTVEVWEADSMGVGDGPRRHTHQLPMSRDEKKVPTHIETIVLGVTSKSRKRRRPATSTPKNLPGAPKPEGNAASSAAGSQSSASSSSAAGNGGGAGGGPASTPAGNSGGGQGAAGGGLAPGNGSGNPAGLSVIADGEDGQEVDPERQAAYQAQDANPCPVLWVKVDPELEWIMCVRMRKPWHQWVEQLFCDESVEAQCDALRGLVDLPLSFEAKNSEVPVQAIAEAVRGRVAHTQMEHAPCVRQEAAVALALWQNQHAPQHAGGFGESKEARAQSWKGLYNLLEAFRERFELREQSSTSAGGGVAGRTNTALHLPNWFEDGAEYRLKKSLIWAAANIRAHDGCTPMECLDLLITLLRENDNSENTMSDDYYIAQVLTALGQMSTSAEAGLPALSIGEAIVQARSWLDLDMLGVPADDDVEHVGRARAINRTRSHNGVVSACAIQCLCQLELLRGGKPEVDYMEFSSDRYPTTVRVAAIQAVVHIFLAYDRGAPKDAPAEGLSLALRWVLDFVQEEFYASDSRPRYWAIRCLLDALERRPMVASHLARFQTDDPLLGGCDPWAGTEFFTPRGPGRSAYRPDGPLPKDFPGAAELAERLWKLMTTGTAFDQGLRHLCFQLWRDIWGLETPPCLKGRVKEKTPGWRERLIIGESRASKGFANKRQMAQVSIDGMVDQVKGWVMSRHRRRDWINRDWIAWYYRDRLKQVQVGQKRKADDDEEDDDITAIPFDGQYGPEPPKDTPDRVDGNAADRKDGHASQWEEGAVEEGAADREADGIHKRPRLVMRMPGQSGL